MDKKPRKVLLGLALLVFAFGLLFVFDVVKLPAKDGAVSDEYLDVEYIPLEASTVEELIDKELGEIAFAIEGTTFGLQLIDFEEHKDGQSNESDIAGTADVYDEKSEEVIGQVPFYMQIQKTDKKYTIIKNRESRFGIMDSFLRVWYFSDHTEKTGDMIKLKETESVVEASHNLLVAFFEENEDMSGRLVFDSDFHKKATFKIPANILKPEVNIDVLYQENDGNTIKKENKTEKEIKEGPPIGDFSTIEGLLYTEFDEPSYFVGDKEYGFWMVTFEEGNSLDKSISGMSMVMDKVSGDQVRQFIFDVFVTKTDEGYELKDKEQFRYDLAMQLLREYYLLDYERKTGEYKDTSNDPISIGFEQIEGKPAEITVISNFHEKIKFKLPMDVAGEKVNIEIVK